MKQLFSSIGNKNRKAVIHEKRETHEINFTSTPVFCLGALSKAQNMKLKPKQRIGNKICLGLPLEFAGQEKVNSEGFPEICSVAMSLRIKLHSACSGKDSEKPTINELQGGLT